MHFDFSFCDIHDITSYNTNTIWSKSGPGLHVIAIKEIGSESLTKYAEKDIYTTKQLLPKVLFSLVQTNRWDSITLNTGQSP